MHENDEYDDDHDKMTLMMLAIPIVLVKWMTINDKISDNDKSDNFPPVFFKLFRQLPFSLGQLHLLVFQANDLLIINIIRKN